MPDTYFKIKQTLSNGSGSCVVLRGDNPYCVVMAWQEYEKFANMVKDNELKNGRDNVKTGIDINSIPV